MADSKSTFQFIIILTFLKHEIFLKTLTTNLGCFPLDNGPYRSLSVYGIFFIRIQSFSNHNLISQSSTVKKSFTPYKFFIPHSTKIDFAENQIYPNLISLSPLIKVHPSILQHTQVRSFINLSKEKT